MTGAPRGRAVVLSGTGRFADQWHPFDQTSARLAAIAEAQGFAAEVAGPDDRLADLSDAQLVIVNIGAPSAADPGRDAAGRRGLLDYLKRGGPALIMHVSATSLPAVPEWEPVIGGIWVRGTTMHPDYGLARVHVYPDRHPIVAGLADFELYDERYSYLRVASDVVPLATHWHGGIEHPLLWARTWPALGADATAGPGAAAGPDAAAGPRPSSEPEPEPGAAARPGSVLNGASSPWPGSRGRRGSTAGWARVVYDALGHDGQSYDSPEHVEILSRAIRWLASDLS